MAKQEKEQESLVSWRKNVGDNLNLSALYKYQVNDFDETIERLPELKLSWYQQPVFDSGLYLDLDAGITNLRGRSAMAGGDTPRHGRLDLANTWSYPVTGLNPYLVVRPFAFARYTVPASYRFPAASSNPELLLLSGQTLAIFVIVVAAAEVALGLALIIAIARREDTSEITNLNLMRVSSKIKTIHQQMRNDTTIYGIYEI